MPLLQGRREPPYANHNVYRMAWICEKEWVDLELEGVIEKRSPYGYNNIWSMGILSFLRLRDTIRQ